MKLFYMCAKASSNCNAQFGPCYPMKIPRLRHAFIYRLIWTVELCTPENFICQIRCISCCVFLFQCNYVADEL